MARRKTQVIPDTAESVHVINHPARQPMDKTVRKVVEYLQQIGLEVYGPCINLDTGQMLGANMDFDADDILKYRKLEKIWIPESY